jgi:glycosyltransferase involved in cell wall biosynthesis
VSRDSVQDAVRRAAVVVVPSVWHDVLPTVVIEALANGRPVLGTALGGIPYLVDAAGWIVAPDRSALAAALPVARDNAAALAPAARRRYETTFHPDVVTKQLLAVYQSMVR